MIDWPISLIREVGRRRAFVFLGAGVSSSAVHSDGDAPQTWEGFINTASDLITNPVCKKEVIALIQENKYLLALQAIKDNVNPAEYDYLINKSFNNPKFKASKLHEHILDLDLEIVVTTNFDKIYENYCHYTSEEGYRVLTYESEDFGDLLRTDTRLIIKAHGCINNARSIVFTKAQYHKAKKDNPQFYEILKAIFLTHTCIFIGCSMEDPDILLALEDVKITSSSTFPHYVITREGANTELAKRDWNETYNITALEYGPDHTDLNLDLKTLNEKVAEFRSLY
ncbi:MAG: SIR2 family protein [Marinomonas colpomeniae]